MAAPSITVGTGSGWYADQKPNAVKKYYENYRQRDTLMGIPKIIEDIVKREDEEAYNNEVALAKERRDNTFKDSTEDGKYVQTFPAEAAIVNDEEKEDIEKAK